MDIKYLYELVTALEGKRMRFEDIAHLLDLKSLELAKMLNVFIEKGYIKKVPIQTSEFFLEDYYIINNEKINEINKEIEESNLEDKTKYILDELKTMVKIGVNNMEQNSKSSITLSTVNISEKNVEVIQEKLDELRQLIQELEAKEETGDKKWSLATLLVKRTDLNKY